MSQMTPKEAFEIASQWADTGAGAVFYNFHAGDARPANEVQRAQCLAYIDALRAAAPSAQDDSELAALREFFLAAELYPVGSGA